MPEERRQRFDYGRADAGPGTTKHYVIAARIQEKADRGKYNMFGDKQQGPPGWLLDEIAEKKLSGGFDLRRKNLCQHCWTFRPKNGKCCEEAE